MNRLDLLGYALIASGVATVVFLGWVFLVVVPESNQRANEFVSLCEQAGGVPSLYETTVGKTHHSERLCIKRESVVEIER